MGYPCSFPWVPHPFAATLSRSGQSKVKELPWAETSNLTANCPVQHGRWRIFAWLKEEGMIDLNAPLAEPPARTCTGDGDPADGEVCAICLDPLPIPALCCTLGCNHVMCRKCVREHFCFSSDYHGSCAPCPLCRREVSASLSTRVFHVAQVTVASAIGWKCRSRRKNGPGCCCQNHRSS